MSSLSDEEQDNDNNIFDQLKSIKAFTVDQLFSLHPDVGCPTSSHEQDDNRATSATTTSHLGDASKTSDSHHDHELYQNLIDYEQLRNKLSKLRAQVKYLNRKTFDHVDKIWYFTEEAPRKIGMCQQGKIAETTFKYKQAFINSKQLNVFDLSFNELIDLISKDYIYYSFESQMNRNKIATQLSIAYKLDDEELRCTKLKSSITTLINFLKHLGDSKSDFILQCRKWLRGLIKRFLVISTIDNYKFIIAQLCKGPSGTADWSSDLVEFKPVDHLEELKSTPQYITNCSALLSELFNNLRTKVRRVTISTTDTTTTEAIATSDQSEQNWSLVDPKFNCSEELSPNSSGTLSENDVIKYCLRIPVAEVFRGYVRKCLANSDTDKNYEFTMLKLLTIGTVIIKTYQIGLETFNSIQYGNLIEYLSSQIRRTVIVLSDQWSEFKRRLKGTDNALMMRLQVEYDNFILRSILIILELRQSGIWRHLSSIEPEDLLNIDNTNSWSADNIRPAFAKLLQVTGLTSPTTTTSSQTIETEKIAPATKSSNSLTYEFSIEWFKEVSEPMLWHILWQFYHNAFVNSCDYHSDNYWLEKFQEKSVIYLFVNKIRDSPSGECSYLLNSVTNMLLSRARPESNFISFVATELFNLSFRYKELREKITKKGIKSLIRCAEKFPFLISLYMSFINEEDIDDNDIISLFKGCSLNGWLCNEGEFELLGAWLVENPLSSVHNKVARIIISKLFLNSELASSSTDCPNFSIATKKIAKEGHCFVDLKLRRRFALILYESTVRLLPENNYYKPSSFGASVEVIFETLFCEKYSVSQVHLLELAVDSNYQQFYVWCWRLLFTFRLHILNQPDTDWNDVQTRSGTSRSIKNTVLLNDSFHPAPTIQDSEFLSISEGVRNQNPMALFIYLLMTDITWQADSSESCLEHLNTMANSGHLTPSLMAMKYLIICHLNDLSTTIAKDSRCLDYFTALINSNFDATRLASLIITQMQNLKQYRQLQLSQFYITILLEVAVVIFKELSSSWFSGGEFKLEKIACLLDYIVKFNFSTQRLEIVRKFYDCSYSIQNCKASSGWLGSFFAANPSNTSSSRREFMTTAHVLAHKYKKFSWLRWVITECDTLRLEKIWEDIVLYLSTNEDANLDAAIKKVCPQINPTVLKAAIPIYSWIDQIFDIVECDLSHPLCPLIWYNFFLNYFSNSLNGVSVGLKLVPQETQTKLLTRLDSLFNYHLYKHRNWSSPSNMTQNSLAQLYRAFRLWLQDISLQDAYVDMDRLREDYLVPLLKAIMESSTEDSCLQYIDVNSIEKQNRNLSQIWVTSTILEGNNLIKDMIFVNAGDQNESVEILTSFDNDVSDATSLIIKPTNNQPEHNKLLANAEEEFKSLISNSLEKQELSTEDNIGLVKKHCQYIFEESTIFGSSIHELDELKSEISELVQQLYTNKKCEHVRVIPCVDGNECLGPARIKFEVEEATIDDRKSECIQDRQRQCDELVEELLLMPSNRIVNSSILIEDSIKVMIKDSNNATTIIKSLLNWLSDPENYEKVNLSFYTANHVLKTILDILSTTGETDTYNSTMIQVCLDHPGSVQIFSPYLSPSACSAECFLDLYKKVSFARGTLGPTALFVILSKFDLNLWLRKNTQNKTMFHDIIQTTCSALSDMGKRPDDSLGLSFDLFKCHIQTELAPPDRRRPEEISIVLGLFLNIMDNQSLEPSLWIEFMNIVGLERRKYACDKSNQSRNTSILNKSLQSTSLLETNQSRMTLVDEQFDESSIVNLIEDVAQLADCQSVFDYHALNNMMIIISQFIRKKDFASDTTLLELYRDYLDQFSLVLISITFMWIKSISEQYPDNHNLIWKQYMEIWYNWVFLTKNCQNVAKEDYSLLANQFVSSLKFMIFKIPDNTQFILQSILATLAMYVQTTKEVVYLELTILQRYLKNLPWSILVATPDDYDNLAILSEQENYNVSDLVSHILLQINTKESLIQINEIRASAMPHVAERLATTIVLQSTHLKGFRLYGNFFTMIPIYCIENIIRLILPRMEFANLEHSQNNKLLVNLLRFMCIKLEDSQHEISDSFERSNIYARFVSNYLISLIKNHPTVIKYHKPYIFAVMDNSLQDLKILLSPDVEIMKKTILYESLLECCSSVQIDENSRLVIARSLIKSSIFKNRPIALMEVFYAIGQIISDARVLVYTIEKMISSYLNMNGHYEKVWKSFNLKVLPSDLYLEACIQEKAPLALLVYFEVLLHNNIDNQDSMSISDNSSSIDQPSVIRGDRIWSSFFHWISQLNVTTYVNSSNEIKSNDIRLAIAWIRLLDMLESNLYQFIHYDQHIKKSFSGLNDDVESASETISINSKTDRATNKPEQSKTSRGHQSANVLMIPRHKSLIDFIKQLISMYDSCNSGGLWSYLKFVKNEQTSRLSIIALSTACFLANRTLNCLNMPTKHQNSESDDIDKLENSRVSTSKHRNAPATSLTLFKDEVIKLKKSCLIKLEAARKSKLYLDNMQFIEAIIESVNQNDKVQYSDGVQLITTFVKNIYLADDSDDFTCMSKILPPFNE